MRKGLLATFTVFAASAAIFPVPGEAQVPPGARPPGQAQQQQAQQQQAGELNLVFDREVFVYPRAERRDPFVALLSQDESGPRFEEIELIGVVLSPNPDLSVAVFGLKGSGNQGGNVGGQGGGGARARAYRVRRGDTLGNVRILEIQLTRVVVAVDEFGETQQQIMELQRPGQGGL